MTGLAVEANTLSATLPASLDRLAANITGTSGFTYSDDDGLTVTTIAVGGHTVTGVMTADGTVSLIAGDTLRGRPGRERGRDCGRHE